MAKIKAVTLVDKDGNLKYPRTYTKLVTNSKGEDLDTLLGKIKESTDSKADTDEYYPQMSVGVADNLTGRGEAIEREFVFAQSGGVTNSIPDEDTARIDSIQGNTLVYNGELINNNTTAIKTVGFNAFDGEKAKVIGGVAYELLGTFTSVGFATEIGGELTAITIPANLQYTPTEDGYIYAEGSDICIHLVNTGYRNGEYEPYIDSTRQLPTVEGGLKSAGTVYDEIKFNKATLKWEYIKRVGEVDLGDLPFVYDSTNNIFYITNVENYTPTGAYKELKTPIYNWYNDTNSTSGFAQNAVDNSVQIIAADDSNPTAHLKLMIKNTSYTDATSFKAAMQGVMMYYELVEPIITELDSDNNPDYKVWDWGTEQAIQVAPSAPFKGRIVYGFNAVDQIRGNKLNIDNLLSDVSRIESNISVYPSGDPMHNTYVAAGAVWDGSTKTWSANGKTGLSNADIRSLYNNSDMDELLFRKLWNTVNLADNDSANFGRYNPATGFYELNGIWDLTYQQALDIYANSESGVLQGSNLGSLNTPLTTIRTNDVYFSGFAWSRIVDFNKAYRYTADDTCLIPNPDTMNGTRIYYSFYLRRIYPMISSDYYRNNYLRIINCPSLLHVFFIRPNRNIYVNGAPLISYQSLFLLINYYRGTSGINVYVDADTYSYIAGTADPTTLSMSPIDNGYTDIIPYMKNHKGKLNEGVSVGNAAWTPDNIYWREENDVKGINGEYIYPSFAEYLAANPARFATAADWQALATLAEEKGITITTA